MLLAVDEAVAGVLRSLRRSGRLADTLVVYMSDNGLLIGDHHTIGKDMPYRFATDVPLLLRWDGHVAAGAVDRRLVSTVDVTETILRAAGATMPTSGVDLMAPPAREHVALEGRRWRRLDGSVPHPGFCGVRTERWLFVRWGDGFEELYDHEFDRSETVNRVADPAQLPVVDALRETARASCVPEPPGFSWDVASDGGGAAGSAKSEAATCRRGHHPVVLGEQRCAGSPQGHDDIGRREAWSQRDAAPPVCQLDHHGPHVRVEVRSVLRQVSDRDAHPRQPRDQAPDGRCRPLVRRGVVEVGVVGDGPAGVAVSRRDGPLPRDQGGREVRRRARPPAPSRTRSTAPRAARRARRCAPCSRGWDLPARRTPRRAADDPH